MYKPIDFKSVEQNQHTATKGRKDLRACKRNAIARKKLERRRDRELLRQHVEEVWNSAAA